MNNDIDSVSGTADTTTRAAEALLRKRLNQAYRKIVEICRAWEGDN